MIGSHTPRQCGIATFTTDLSQAIALEYPGLECFVVAMNDPGRHHAYPARVRFEIAESDIASYRRAADFLNVNPVDVVCLQHEYGIFGGKAGAHILTLLAELRMPIVTTLHTILADPNPLQRRAMDELLRLSTRVVVMSEKGRELLLSVHGMAPSRVDLIPHGIPNVPPQAKSKDRLGVEGNHVLFTFGLLSPDKGIEYVIDAMPEIVARFSNALYIVLGATHPHIRERQGETYRLMLESRAERLGVDAHIIFHDRFVSQSELKDFLAAADIYITPYLKPEQITSGTLAYAVGSGRAVISTPYWYAEELLADGRGVIVPWRDPKAIAREVNALLGDDTRRHAMRKRAAEYGQSMRWPNVARAYGECFERARTEHKSHERASFQARTLARRPADLPEINLSHLALLTDDTGLLQHAAFSVPRYEDGYCLDDNARALLLMTYVEDSGADLDKRIRGLSARYLAFVRYAFQPSLGRFRNFMSFSRNWMEEVGSEDSHGRALWALGTVVGRAESPGRKSLSGDLFHAALPAVLSFTSPRSWAYALIGLDEYLRAFQGDTNVETIRNELATRLYACFEQTSGQDWPWFENTVTYCNARLSQALITSGRRMLRDEITEAGTRSLAWLCELQKSPEGYFMPIGSNGFYPKGGPIAANDQQPVEACAMISACLEAHRVTGEGNWLTRARRILSWFFGQNTLRHSLYDAATGGCHDGLHQDRPNENQGAEATLSLLLALSEIRAADLLRLERPIPRAVTHTMEARPQ